MKAKMTKFKPKFEITLTAEEVVHLEAALDFASTIPNVSEEERFTACFGLFEDDKSNDVLYKLWRGFSQLRDDVMTSGGLDDE